jgi:hypothetical protein
MVAPSANSLSSRSSLSWSTMPAPVPPPLVKERSARVLPFLAMRRNGVRSPRSDTSSSTAALENRSLKAAGRSPALDNSGSAPQ